MPELVESKTRHSPIDKNPPGSIWSARIKRNGGPDAKINPEETGFSHWRTPNNGATNSTGFTALPGGSRIYKALFGPIGYNCAWWSSTEWSLNMAYIKYIGYNSENIYINHYDKYYGYSVRCLRD